VSLERLSLRCRGSGGVTGLGKRETREEDSILGIISVDLCELDLSKVLRGDSLTFPCTISQNGIGIKN